MNYQRIYTQFIDDRRAREPAIIASGVYTERHHIVPRSMGGGDEPENLITLTAGDHFFAHLLLAKAHGGEQWNSVALMMERKRRTTWKLRRAEYAIARKGCSEYRKTLKGVNAVRLDAKSYLFRNVDGNSFHGRRIDLAIAFKIPPKQLQPLFSEKPYLVCGWYIDGMNPDTMTHLKGNNHPQADTHKYTFKHRDGRTITGTRHDLRKIANATPFHVSKLVRGENKSCKGWVLV